MTANVASSSGRREFPPSQAQVVRGGLQPISRSRSTLTTSPTFPRPTAGILILRICSQGARWCCRCRCFFSHDLHVNKTTVFFLLVVRLAHARCARPPTWMAFLQCALFFSQCHSSRSINFCRWLKRVISLKKISGPGTKKQQESPFLDHPDLHSSESRHPLPVADLSSARPPVAPRLAAALPLPLPLPPHANNQNTHHPNSFATLEVGD
ncbi:uncharacterized protein IWZ02DRAFT_129121 [Phyllosticta citriasiana]|uniref:uncharacterized protein n=1 Tax=Phyllosticta citriasiana TaxID=595635 RepID=UPI0030FD8903